MPYDQVLDLATLDGLRGVYVLGVYARRVTFFSQQARAINLVDAIHHYHASLTGSHVAVVGAGAAGVTAAARALHYGAKVTLFDKTAAPISVQRASAHRWIHPSIYDWPFSAVDPAEDRARLPVMDWSAVPADRLAADLASQLETLKGSGGLTFVPSTEVEQVHVGNDERVPADADKGGRVHLRWKRSSGGEAGQTRCDVAILAVGFGLEPYNSKQNSYWEGDPIDNVARGDSSVLVIGYGDGALTDLMRACLLNFKHEEVFKQVLARTSAPEILDRIRAIERHPSASRDHYLTEKYRELDVPALASLLAGLRNPNRKVVLAGPGPDLFASGACALNRVIVSQLFRLKAFHHVTFDERGRIDAADPADPLLAGVVKKVEAEIGETPKHVLLRFGPVSVIARIGGIERELKQLKDRWQQVPAPEDLTRERLWDSPVFGTSRTAENLLVFGAGEALGNLALVAGNALERLRQQSVRVVEVDVEACFSNRASLLHTVGVICTAPIALFALSAETGNAETASDNTDNDNLAGMLLLGVRSAVRRGVTLVASHRELTAEDWSNLPFDLKELQILVLPSDTRSAAVLAESIAGAQSILRREAASYRDTPVFDIVRRTERRTPPLKKDETEVFTLCSFSEKHETKLWPTLRLLLEGVQRLENGSLQLRRVRDYMSPLLVGERLYELIRFSGLCLVDLSEWRPNVFYELGVRLAVHATPPICVIQESDLAGIDAKPKAYRLLVEFLRPIPYPVVKAHKRREQFQEALAAELERRTAIKPPSDTPYAAASRNIDLTQERGGNPFHQTLWQQALVLLGRDVVKSGRIPVLYGESVQVASQSIDAAIDVLWSSYLLIQEQLAATGGADETLSDSLTHVESLLTDLLERSTASRFDRLRERLGA